MKITNIETLGVPGALVEIEAIAEVGAIRKIQP